MNQEALHTNRLIHERSPYLLQHAHNPVDWYPWAEEALARARDEEKPIFLSIGYSTCHWCHVMERESFENEEIARLLNEQFVPIKVDREERPDLDKLYMAAVHAQTGRGGWPLSVFLTPDLQPFFGGTYFPPEDRWGRPGFETLLTRIAEAWRTDREDLVENSVRITEFLRKQSGHPGAVAGEMSLGKGILTQAFEQLKRSYDGRHAGFGQAPKFPTPHNLTFLLRYAHRTGTQEALQMVRSTLDAMAAGGIHDHLGGGFHRYSTDAEWLVPHFEKMLYDQAGLATAYTDAWLVTRDLTYAAVARDILEYVLNYLRDPAGGFFSAEDADSEGEEGTFYVWTAEEILALLGEKPGQAFNQEFGVRPGGNWEGRSILNRASPRPALGRAMDRSRAGLLEARNRRPRPRRDEKIIAAWNGYMIEAFARAGRALPEPRYIKAAEDAARFIEENLWRDGRLMRYERAGVADALGCLDDYAFLGRGLLALYEATFRPRYLARAVGLAREMVRLFHRSRGGFAFTGSDAESLLAPVVEIGDGAMPSSNSAASLFLLRLGHLTADTEMEQQGRRVLQAFQRAVSRSPGSHLEMLSALDFALGPVTEVLIAAPSPDASSDPAVAAMIGKLWDRYLPNTVSALRPEDGAEAITSLIPYAKQQGMIDGIVTAYVCRDYACTLPVHDARALAEELETD